MCIAGPRQSEAGSTGESHPPINHQNFSVRPIIGIARPENIDGMIEFQLNPGTPHEVDVCFACSRRSHIIKNHFDLHSGLGPLRESLRELTGHRSIHKSEGLKGNTFLCPTHRSQHGWEKSIAIRQSADVIARDPRRPGHFADNFLKTSRADHHFLSNRNINSGTEARSERENTGKRQKSNDLRQDARQELQGDRRHEFFPG